MSILRTLSMSFLLALLPAIALAQASPSPPTGTLGGPISDMSRMTRQRDTNEQYHSNTMATLNLTFNSSGDLKSSLIKNEGHSLFTTVEINGALIKRIAKSEKPKVQEAVKPGPIDVKVRWARPGKRTNARCTGELVVGFQQIVVLPYGGVDGLSCHVEMRSLPQEVYDQWKAGLDADQAEARDVCGSQHSRGSADFWLCIDSAGVPFPAA